MNLNCIRCRDCRHWTPSQKGVEQYSCEQPPDRGYFDGVCRRIRDGVTINVSGGWDGATVDSVETDANFSCIFAESKPFAVTVNTMHELLVKPHVT